jgi:dipeptidyl aminopeptidase/acylaminoacyl peptidase
MMLTVCFKMFLYMFYQGSTMHTRIISKICLLLVSLSSMLNSEKSIAASVEDFSKHAQYHNVKISPDGKHLAALVTSGNTRSLVFLETDSYKVTYSLNANSKNQAGDYYWVNNERVVIQIQQMRGALEQPLNYGELYAVNYDGSKKRMIFGYRAEGSSMSRGGSSSGASYYSGNMIDKLESEPKSILVEKRRFTRTGDSLEQVIKLNIYNGKEREVKSAPMTYSSFLIDKNGQPRFASAIDKHGKNKLFYSEGKGGDWNKFDLSFKGTFKPISFGTDNHSIYALKGEQGKPQGLYKYDLKTQEESLLYKSDIADPTYAMKSDLNKVYAVRVDEDYPKYVYLDETIKDAQLHKTLYRYFKGDNVAITSKTADEEQLILHVSSDRNPGSFYLFNTKSMKNKHLFSSAPWIKTEDMAEMEPFRIKSKDGLVLNGFITLPKGKDKNLPTVVLPHGGPHARDYWSYHPQVQMLANAGYAVVQVNFRGSTGYGESFEVAGYGNWGTKIQDDIILATNYVVQQGISDKNRLCVFGTSFGGYSALQSAIRKPDLYKCAIGYAGVYDLPMLYNEGDIKTVKWGDAYLDKTLGTDVTEQKAQSPVHNVDKLKAAIFIIHGEDDERAPIEHAEALKASLEAINYPFEWLVKDKEGHGFYNEDNILETNQKILSFLDKHIGS